MWVSFSPPLPTTVAVTTHPLPARSNSIDTLHCYASLVGSLWCNRIQDHIPDNGARLARFRASSHRYSSQTRTVTLGAAPNSTTPASPPKIDSGPKKAGPDAGNPIDTPSKTPRSGRYPTPSVASVFCQGEPTNVRLGRVPQVHTTRARGRTS